MTARILTLATCAALAVSPAFGKTVIRVATIIPDGTPMMEALRGMADKVTQETGGEVEFRFFAGATAGDEELILEKMRGNTIHAAAFTGVGLGKILPEIRILEIPWFYSSEEETRHVLDQLSDRFVGRMQDEGYVHLGWNIAGAVYVFSKKRVSSVEDMKQAKPWIWEGDPLAEEVFRSFGINPIPGALTGVLTSLQTDRIDTVYNTPSALIGLQWHGSIQYMIDYPIVYTVGAFIMTDKAFARIPEKHREKVRSICLESSKSITGYIQEENAKAMRTLQGTHKVELLAPLASDAATFSARGAEVAEKLTGKLWDARLMERVQEILEEYRDE